MYQLVWRIYGKQSIIVVPKKTSNSSFAKTFATKARKDPVIGERKNNVDQILTESKITSLDDEVSPHKVQYIFVHN